LFCRTNIFSGELTGIISERDYISKIALLGRTSKETQVKEIATMSSKLVTVTVSERYNHKIDNNDVLVRQDALM